MIANVRFLLPARPHKIRHVQLVWRHDNNLPTKRIRLECVSFLTNTVTILIHPREWLSKRASADRSDRTDTLDSDIIRRRDTKNNDRAMDDNDEIWATEADHRTGWNKTFKSGTYRVMMYGIVLRDDPNQVVSRTKAKSVPTNMCQFFFWAQRHFRIDVTASTVERKTGVLASAGACPGGCKEYSRNGSNAYSISLKCKICGTVRKEERHPQRQDPVNMFSIDTRTTGRVTHTRERRVVLIVELTLILFRVHSRGNTFSFFE